MIGRELLDEHKEEFDGEAATRHSACMSCRGNVGSRRRRRGEIPKLTGGQIRAKLGGMELTDNVHWRDLYQRNGTVMSTSMGRKRAGERTQLIPNRVVRLYVA